MNSNKLAKLQAYSRRRWARPETLQAAEQAEMDVMAAILVTDLIMEDRLPPPRPIPPLKSHHKAINRAKLAEAAAKLPNQPPIIKAANGSISNRPVARYTNIRSSFGISDEVHGKK